VNRHWISGRSGLTLLELLAVIAIVGLLASLVLGGVHNAHARAKDRVWRVEAPGFISLIQDRLSRYYQSQISYPASTTDELYRRHVFDDRIMGFLRSPNVTFIPFSSTDSDDKWILKVVNIWPEEKSPTGLLKKSVTTAE
jgi:prepilin-type N-terminal cleavage/methylation domain-containing protein